MKAIDWFIGIPQNGKEKYEFTYDEICKLLDDFAQHQAQLQQHNVSGKRPDLKHILIAYKNEQLKLNDAYNEILAACASGAVDTVAAGGDEQDCICPDYECLLGKPNRCAKPARKSSEGQP